MSKAFQPVNFKSHENGLIVTVEDNLTAHLLANGEKKHIIQYEKGDKSKQGKQTKAKNNKLDDELEQELR